MRRNITAAAPSTPAPPSAPMPPHSRASGALPVAAAAAREALLLPIDGVAVGRGGRVEVDVGDGVYVGVGVNV